MLVYEIVIKITLENKYLDINNYFKSANHFRKNYEIFKWKLTWLLLDVWLEKVPESSCAVVHAVAEVSTFWFPSPSLHRVPIVELCSCIQICLPVTASHIRSRSPSPTTSWFLLPSHCATIICESPPLAVAFPYRMNRLLVVPSSSASFFLFRPSLLPLRVSLFLYFILFLFILFLFFFSFFFQLLHNIYFLSG